MMAKFKNKAPWEKEYTVMEFSISQEEFNDCLNEWRNGKLIQEAFPMLSDNEREFIMTGITPEEWERMINE